MQFTVVLLLRHLVTVATVGAANQFAFSLLTVSILLLDLDECFFDFSRCRKRGERKTENAVWLLPSTLNKLSLASL